MKTEFLKQVYYSPNRDNLKSLITYLESLEGRKFKSTQIANYITKTKWKKKESKTLFRVHIQIITKYLKQLNYDLSTDKKIIKSIIGDITEVFKIYENKSNEDLEWIILSTNVLPSFVHFKQIKSLFEDKQLGCSVGKSNDYDLLSVFGARLALEKRVLGLLKIDYALVAGKPIGISKLINLVESLDSIEFHHNLDWKLIQKVNKWLNHYIHRQLRPWPWSIFQIYQYLDVILENGVIEKDGRTIYSFYYSTVVVDEKKLDEELRTKLSTEFRDISIKWRHVREAVKLNKSDQQLT